MKISSSIGMLLLLLFPICYSYGDPGIKQVGTPIIRQYKRVDFKAGQQTWMIEQGLNGMMYFANNDGLLEFDGKEWITYELPNRTIVRCIRSDSQGRMYAGGFNEFGYFETDGKGAMAYHSMTDLLPEDQRDFGEIWKIHVTPFGLVFQSFEQIMIMENDEVTVIKAPDQFHFSFFVQGELYIVDRANGLLRLSLGKLFPVVGTESLKGKEIWGILPFYDKLLMATAGSGIFLYDGSKLEMWAPELSKLLSELKVFSILPIDPGLIAFGTIQGGLIISDMKGKILQSINRDQGLQNNTVLSMGKDDFGNLWLGLDNGIDYIEINSPLSLLSYHHGLSSGYAAVIHNDILYLGTNQGVYAVSWDSLSTPGHKDLALKMVTNTSGQVWTLQDIDGTLFCGHNNGTFLIDGYQATSISDLSGGWIYLQPAGNPDKVIGGTYLGLVLYEKINGKWAFSRRIKGFNESSREILQDDKGDIWMGHGLKGIFRIRLDNEMDSVENYRFFNSADNLPSDFGLTLFKLRDSIFVGSQEGIYQFDETRQEFTHPNGINQLLNKKDIRKITTDRQGNIWYFADRSAGVFRIQEDGSYLDITLPFEQIKGSFIGGFQFVYPFDDRNVFFGTEYGFVHYDPFFAKDYSRPIHTYIREVRMSYRDSLLFQGMISESGQELENIDFNFNSLRFYFAANDFENPERIMYSTYLEGLDQTWSGWDLQNNREFTNLHEGRYVFHVKARNIYNAESAPVTYSFIINPPWRRSVPAYIFYGFVFILGTLIILFLLKRKIDRSRKEAEAKKEVQFREREEELERYSLEAEKEIIRLRNEKLSEEMVLKDKELANSTLQMIQKNKLLISLKEELLQFAASSKESSIKIQIRSLVKKIDRDIDNESQWKVFETHFEKVHEEFLQRIKSEFPQLTPRELKLCAYLRMNISSKEIALLMNISTRGVEISRYRLRKKLGLDRKSNLTDFILSY